MNILEFYLDFFSPFTERMLMKLNFFFPFVTSMVHAPAGNSIFLLEAVRTVTYPNSS